MLTFYRFIAKIGHAFTAAELGPNGFTPTLLNLIQGQPPMFAAHYVGSGLTNDPPSSHMHEIGFSKPLRPEDAAMIVVRIRLFANLDMPTHYAVTGMRLQYGPNL
jgi:hypothetical protein